MASKDDAAGLNHPATKKFGSVDGAKKKTQPTDTTSSAGTQGGLTSSATADMTADKNTSAFNPSSLADGTQI